MATDRLISHHYYHNPVVSDLKKMEDEARHYAKSGVFSRVHEHAYGVLCRPTTCRTIGPEQ